VRARTRTWTSRGCRPGTTASCGTPAGKGPHRWGRDDPRCGTGDTARPKEGRRRRGQLVSGVGRTRGRRARARHGRERPGRVSREASCEMSRCGKKPATGRPETPRVAMPDARNGARRCTNAAIPSLRAITRPSVHRTNARMVPGTRDDRRDPKKKSRVPRKHRELPCRNATGRPMRERRRNRRERRRLEAGDGRTL
jgi:hypothetical protein